MGVVSGPRIKVIPIISVAIYKKRNIATQVYPTYSKREVVYGKKKESLAKIFYLSNGGWHSLPKFLDFIIGEISEHWYTVYSKWEPIILSQKTK